MFDTGVALRAFGDRPDEPDSPICAALFRAAVRAEKRILLSAPAMAEVLRGWHATGLNKQTFGFPGLELVDFDAKAARLLGMSFPKKLLKQYANEHGVSYREISIDGMIVASAVRHGATAIVALDSHFHNMAAEIRFRCHHPADFLSRKLRLPFPPPPLAPV